MTQAAMKIKVGYVQPEWAETCGTCANCTERGNHLRCVRHGFAVVAQGICRNGYVKGPRQIEMIFPLMVIPQPEEVLNDQA